jgi:hypothetical protein
MLASLITGSLVASVILLALGWVIDMVHESSGAAEPHLNPAAAPAYRRAARFPRTDRSLRRPWERPSHQAFADCFSSGRTDLATMPILTKTAKLPARGQQ